MKHRRNHAGHSLRFPSLPSYLLAHGRGHLHTREVEKWLIRYVHRRYISGMTVILSHSCVLGIMNRVSKFDASSELIPAGRSQRSARLLRHVMCFTCGSSPCKNHICILCWIYERAVSSYWCIYDLPNDCQQLTLSAWLYNHINCKHYVTKNEWINNKHDVQTEYGFFFVKICCNLRLGFLMRSVVRHVPTFYATIPFGYNAVLLEL
jgi:hypothetical protein